MYTPKSNCFSRLFSSTFIHQLILNDYDDYIQIVRILNIVFCHRQMVDEIEICDYCQLLNHRRSEFDEVVTNRFDIKNPYMHIIFFSSYIDYVDYLL